MEANPAVQGADIIFGRWRSQVLYAGVKLGVFDALRSGPKAAAIAAELGLDAALGYRLLRALGSLELLQEDGNRAFALTPLGELLRRDHPQNLRGVALSIGRRPGALRPVEAFARHGAERQAERLCEGIRAHGF